MVIQGRKITTADVQLIQQLLADNPSWGRTRLSIELCELWEWRTNNGQLKDMACRTLLLKLEKRGSIVLPARQRKSTNGFRNRSIAWVPHIAEEIRCSLKTLVPLQIAPVASKSNDYDLFNCLLSRYHYLGHRNTVGENMKYLVRDCVSRPLACLLFGSAAWKIALRDAFIGWRQSRREKKLHDITNNMRFLILPWVKVPHMASHILSRVCKRISSDWMAKYGHPVYLLETFVDCSRFRGTCYRAANWILVGQTKGRTRNDRNFTIKVSVKDIYVYPLIKDFKEKLCNGNDA